MLRLAGREGDGAIINWLSAEDVAQVVPHVHAGGEGKEVVARIFVAPTTDTEMVRNMGRYAIAAYLTVPVYAEFHRWLGRATCSSRCGTRWGRRPQGRARRHPDSLVDALIVHGSPEECRDHIGRYMENGVTCPALAILPLASTPTRPSRTSRPALKDGATGFR